MDFSKNLIDYQDYEESLFWKIFKGLKYVKILIQFIKEIFILSKRILYI